MGNTTPQIPQDQQMKGQIVSSLMAQANSTPNNTKSLAQLT